METRIRHTLSEVFDADVAEEATLENLGGHASLRIYWRIHLPTDLEPPRAFPRGESTLMAMVLPEGVDPLESAEGDSSEAPRPRQMPFVDVQRYLADIGLPVPAIDRVDMERGVLLLEDLGDELFEHAVIAAGDDQEAVQAVYREAIDLLIKVQTSVRKSGDKGKSSTIAFERSFDRELLLWELHHYLEWGLQARLGEEEVAPVGDELEDCFRRLVDELLALPQTLVLRDYQSRNIMRKKGTWVLIDFQDALVGPFIYDLVALLRDSYVHLPAPTVEALVDYYVQQGQAEGLVWCEKPREVRRAFYLQTIQRKLKDAGRFVYIDREKNNASFLDYYGPSIQYVRGALERLDDFDELAHILKTVEPAYKAPQ